MPIPKLNQIDLTAKTAKQAKLSRQLEEAANMKEDHTVVEVAFEDLFPAQQGFSFEVTSTEK